MALLANWLRRLRSVPEAPIASTVAAVPVALPAAIVVKPSSPENQTVNSADWVDKGDAQLSAGLLDAAQNSYRQALLEQRDVPKVLCKLAYVLRALERPQEALEHVQRALELEPNSVEGHLLRAYMATTQNDSAVALASAQKAFELAPESAYALALLHTAQLLQDDYEAIEISVTARLPVGAAPWKAHLAFAQAYAVQLRAGRGDAPKLKELVLHQYQLAGVAHSQCIEVWASEGDFLSSVGQSEQAGLSFKRALELSPSSAADYYWQGISQRGLGELEQATACHARAIAVDSKFALSHKALGNLCNALSDASAAVVHFQRALAADPQLVGAHFDLGQTYMRLGQVDMAIESVQRAIRLRPHTPELLFGLAYIFDEQKKLVEAVGCYRIALAFKPSYHEAKVNLRGALFRLGDTQARLDMFLEKERAAPDDMDVLSNVVACSSYAPQCSPREYLARARRYGQLATQNARPYAEWPRTGVRSGSLRVGLVSADLNRHPVGYFLDGVLSHVDALQLEFHVFSNSEDSDDITERLKARCASWTSIAGLDDEQAAHAIYNMQLDLLVDLSGHTQGHRLPVFAWRPAPVQATWLGYWASTGMAEIDYILTDAHGVPTEHYAHYAERVWELPDTRLCFTPLYDHGDLMTGPLPALSRGYCTFGSYQRLLKITDDVMRLWARVLAGAPAATLRLQSEGLSDPVVRADFVLRLEAAGIAADRVGLHDVVPTHEFMQTHREVDIILDTWPYTGGTTTCMALWMGVPTVTLAGNTLLSRQGMSMLVCAGLPDWVASNEEEYVEKAIKHSQNLHKLGELRSTLRQQVLASPLMDAVWFARNLELQLRAMVWGENPSADPLERSELSVKVLSQQISEGDRARTALHLIALEHFENDFAKVLANLDASDIRPRAATIYKTVGDAYRVLKAHEKAIENFQLAIAHNPEAVDAYVGLGSAQSDMKQYEAARISFDQALALDASCWPAYFGKGIVASLNKQFHQAIASYEQALQLNPMLFEARNNLGSAWMSLGYYQKAVEIFEIAASQSSTNSMGPSNVVYCSSFDPACTGQAYLTRAQRYGALVTQAATPYTSWPRDGDAKDCLRVGLVSGDFYGHPVGYFLDGVLGHVDTDRMELHAFYNNSECDALTERLKLRCASWTSIVGVPDKQAAQLMYEAKLDVLLDLSGHTGGNRLPVFAWRPAPVQATWLGYWASTGVAEIDYILADAHCVPAGSEGNFSEQVWRLPDTRMCFTAPCPLYESLPSPLPALRQGGITFASYQPVLKMNDAVLQTWGRVMQELPNARLRLQSWGLTEPNTQAEILQRLAMAGIAPERVSLHGGQAPQQYLRSHDEADIILDTFPYAAGTTTCNALWMGVPTVTLAGNSMLARQGVSLMGCSGLSDWVANTEDEYVAIAVKQASDVPKLAKLRAGLRQQVFESALMDAPLFAKNLEHCLYAMVQDKLAR